jgi:hypothetical protein
MLESQPDKCLTEDSIAGDGPGQVAGFVGKSSETSSEGRPFKMAGGRPIMSALRGAMTAREPDQFDDTYPVTWDGVGTSVEVLVKWWRFVRELEGVVEVVAEPLVVARPDGTVLVEGIVRGERSDFRR